MRGCWRGWKGDLIGGGGGVGGGGVAVKCGTPSRSLRSRASPKALGEAKCGLRGWVMVSAHR